MLGHVDFAREILSRKPDLASESDSEGFSPLHLASARKNIEMVRLLIRVEPDVCLSTDGDGRTPLHVAAMKGRVEIMKELFQCRPEAAQLLLNHGETILHLCVIHGRLEAMNLLLQWMQNEGSSSSVTVNSKDDDGNTVLHLAVAKKQIQIVKVLLLNRDEVEVNAVNHNGYTALDVLAQNPVRVGKGLKIREVVQIVGGLRSNDFVTAAASASTTTNNHGAHVVRISRDDESSASATREHSRNWKTHLNEHEKWLKKKQNTLMVVASLMASMAFQAVLNPPIMLQEYAKIKINQTDHDSNRVDATTGSPPTSITADYMFEAFEVLFAVYMHCHTIGFVASMIVTILLVSGLPLNRRIFIWVLMFILWAATTSVGLGYMITMDIWFSGAYSFDYIRRSWELLTVFILLMHTTRFILWLLRKTGRNYRRVFLMFWCPIAVGGVLWFSRFRYKF